MRRPILFIFIVVLGVLSVSSLFIVNETEYAIKFQLGRIVKAGVMYRLRRGEYEYTAPWFHEFLQRRS